MSTNTLDRLSPYVNHNSKIHRVELEIMDLKRKYEIMEHDWSKTSSGRARVFHNCVQDMENLLQIIRQ